MRTVQDGATWRRRNYGTHLRRPATRARRGDGSISEIPAPASAMTTDLFAIRTRMRDPGLVAAPSVDPATVRVTFEYVAWATVWLLVGTIIGLIASIKLHWPEFLPYAWLSFGRVRPAHTNLVLLGWSSLALVGLALYVVSRTSRVPPLESALGPARARAVEPGPPRWSRDTAGRREPRPPGISRVGVAAGGH